MTSEMEETLRDAQLAFLGRLLSGFTHEMKNHLAIINESSGLMGDLLGLGRAKEEETCERFRRIIASIAERIDMANVLVKNLNGFAHRMDMPVSAFSINEIIGEEVILLRKFTRLKGIEVELDLQDNLPSVQGNPALIQFLIYLFINTVLKNAHKGDKIKLASGRAEDSAFIRLQETGENAQKERPPDPTSDELVAFVADKLGIKITVDGPARSCISLTLPFGS